MIKLFALLVPRDGMTPLEFFGHWRYEHGPLAGRIRRAHAYVQCHRLPLQPDDLPILPNGGTAEVTFTSLESANGLMDDPDYTDHAAHDEGNFHHMERMTALRCTEHVVVPAPAPVRRDTGGVKVMQFVHRPDGATPEDFRATWLADVAGERELVRELRATRSSRWAQVPDAYTADGAVRFDGVRELWWPDEWAFAVNRAQRPDAWAQLVAMPTVDATLTGFLVTTENRVTWPE